ncbi:hypothetical protein SBADM41S_04383 [Streptomyces badius]
MNGGPRNNTFAPFPGAKRSPPDRRRGNGPAVSRRPRRWRPLGFGPGPATTGCPRFHRPQGSQGSQGESICSRWKRANRTPSVPTGCSAGSARADGPGSISAAARADVRSRSRWSTPTSPSTSSSAPGSGARWKPPAASAPSGRPRSWTPTRTAPVPWVATGYVAGPPLSQAITEHGPLPEHAVRTLGAGLAEALAVVHGQGIVHRDVKPSNACSPSTAPASSTSASRGPWARPSPSPPPGSPSARPVTWRPSRSGAGDVSGAADVFSLGAVLAYAATGAAPFPGDSSAVLLYKVVLHEEPELGDLEGELREVVAGCLAKDPGDRPAPAEPAGARPRRGGGDGGGGRRPGPLVREVSRSAVALLDLAAAGTPWCSRGPCRSAARRWGRGWGRGPARGPGRGGRTGGPGNSARPPRTRRKRRTGHRVHGSLTGSAEQDTPSGGSPAGSPSGSARAGVPGRAVLGAAPPGRRVRDAASAGRRL